MGIEYEWKFRANESSMAAFLAWLDGDLQQIRMQTTYYDTPSGQLSARYYTLRKRMENEQAVCTLKAPGQAGCRGEWEVPCDRIEDAVKKLCKLGAPAELPKLTQEGLVAVCGARFLRVVKTVVLADCTVELAADKGLLLGGERELPLCEIEVELKSGSREVCDRYALVLANKFGLIPEPKSKFRRAFALYKGE